MCSATGCPTLGRRGVTGAAEDSAARRLRMGSDAAVAVARTAGTGASTLAMAMAPAQSVARTRRARPRRGSEWSWEDRSTAPSAYQRAVNIGNARERGYRRARVVFARAGPGYKWPAAGRIRGVVPTTVESEGELTTATRMLRTRVTIGSRRHPLYGLAAPPDRSLPAGHLTHRRATGGLRGAIRGGRAGLRAGGTSSVPSRAGCNGSRIKPTRGAVFTGLPSPRLRW